MFVIRNEDGEFAKGRYYSWMGVQFTYDLDKAKIYGRRSDAKQSRAYTETIPTPEVIPVHVVVCKTGKH